MKIYYSPPPNASDIVGIVSLAHGGTGANLSATGGTNRVVQQASAGAAFTVAQLNQGQIASGAVTATTINASQTVIIAGTAARMLQVDHADSSTSLAANSTMEVIATRNTNNTNNNWSMWTSRSNGGTFDATIAFQHVDQTNAYADTVFANRGSTGFAERMRITSVGIVTMKAVDAVTAAVSNILTISHNSSGTAAASFGTGLLFQAESSTTNDTNQARIRSYWQTATHASRAAVSVWSVYDTAERDAITIQASGSAAQIGFFGTTTALKQTVTGSRGGNAALASLLTALAAYGLITDSSSA